MSLQSKAARWLASTVLITFFAGACHAQFPIGPAQALSYRGAADLRFSPDGSSLALVVYSYEWDLRPRIWILDVSGGSARQITPDDKSERSPQWSPDGAALAFLSNRDGNLQIFTVPAGGGAPTKITSRQHGVANFKWSPDGRTIAYLAREDGVAGAEQRPQVADQSSDLARLWIVDLASTQSRLAGKPGFRIDEIEWQDPSTILAVATDAPRVEEFNEAIYRLSVGDDSVTLLSRPPQPFKGLLVSPDATRFALRSTRAQGPIARDLWVGTIGKDDLRDVSTKPDLAVAEAKWIRDSGLWMRVVDGFHNRLLRLSLKSNPQPIDLPLSCGSFDISRTGVIAFVGSDFDRPSEVYLRTKDGRIHQISHLQKGSDAAALAHATIFREKSFDGLPIESALMKPTSVPAGEKWPLVLLVHGGPSANFSAAYGWDTAWAQMLASHGYQVLMVNPRGSSGYSEEFVKANRGDLGGGDYKDLISVLDAVIAKGETDPNRLGIGGWSYGAEMSVWATTQTHRFKAAVAGAGVFDQQAEFETEETSAEDEWQFGTPWEHPEVFARNSPITYIGNVTTPTLILGGKEDTANPIGQSQGLYRALKHLQVDTQMVVYPGEGHSPRRGSYNVDMFERILGWYDRYLKPPN